MAPLRKIGVLGGTFNPVHNGHLMVASYLCRCADALFDRIWMMVSPHNPLKEETAEVSDAERLLMVELATEGDELVRPCDCELRMKPPFYTINTLRRLAAMFPDCRFSLVIGSDNWNIFSRWYRSEDIIREFGVVVYPRPGVSDPDVASLPQGVRFVPDAPRVEISSTFVRQALGRGKQMRYFIPEAVMNHIAARGLYNYSSSNPRL